MDRRFLVAVLVVAVSASGACGSFGASPSAEEAADGSHYAGGGGEAGEGGGPGGNTTPDAGGTGPGDRIRSIFATASIVSGSIGGIAGGDAECASEASKSNHPAVRGRTFKAWLSVPGDDVAARLVHGTLPYVLPVEDGKTERVAESWDLLAVQLDRPIDHDQHGALVNSLYYAWTGTTSLGASTEPSCGGWTSAASGEGIVGATFKKDISWSLFGPKACVEGARLLCVEN